MLPEGKERRPGRDTDQDAVVPSIRKTPNGTSIGHGATMPAPPQLQARKTMIMGMSIMAEGPVGDADAEGSPRQPSSVVVDASIDKLGASETGYYKRICKLGEGGMGTVYKALMVRTARDGTIVMQRPIAIKAIKFDEALCGLSGDERERTKKTMYDRFLNEVKVIAKLKHPNIIDIVDFGEDDFGEGVTPFYVMELLSGKDLNDIINDSGPIPWEQAMAIMAQVCKALDAAHNHKEKVVDPESGEEKTVPHPIVHRDIKSENIFIVTDDYGDRTAKVLDFGIAKMMAPTVKDPTHGGEMVMGTPHYMAPEQACGLSIDNRTDIYSTGALMYHTLTGCTVFHGESVTELLVKLMNENPVPPRERRPDLDIPEEAERIVMKCLEKDPAKRYQSMAELREDIMRSAGMNTIDIARLQSGDVWDAASGRFVRMDTPNGTAQTRTPNEGEMATSLLQKQKRRKLFWGIGAGALTLAAAVTITALVAGRGVDGDGGAKKPQAASREMQKTKPAPEPMRKDPMAPQVTTLPMAQTERDITLRTELEGVNVLDGERLLCVTKEDGSCGIKLRTGKALTLRLEKEGYSDKKVEIYKDTSGSVAVSMEKKAKRWTPRRRVRKPPMRVKPVWE